MKAINAANAQAAHSTSRASAQAAHDAAMLDAIEDWQLSSRESLTDLLFTEGQSRETYNVATSNVYANWENGVGNLLGDKPEGTGWEEGNLRGQEIKDTQTYGNRPISRYGHFFDETLEEESSVVNENQADLPELPPVGRNNDDVPNLPQTPIPEREINEFVQQFKNKRNTRSGEPIDELALKHLVGQQENVAKRSGATKSLMELATGSPENSGGIAIAAHGKGLPAGSLGPTDTNAFWIGFQNISKARGLESPMVPVVRDYHFPLRSGMQPSYSSYFYNLKKLTVDEFSYGRCVRVGKSVARRVVVP